MNKYKVTRERNIPSEGLFIRIARATWGEDMTVDEEWAIQELLNAPPPSPVDKLLQGYEKIAQSQPLIQPKVAGRRSAYD